MSSEERRKILQMVADGKVDAEGAAALMRALEESAAAESEVIDAGPAMSGERSDAPEIDEVRRRARRFSGAFLWIGILVTVLTAWGMFGIQQNSGLNFWFYCMGMPLTFGILLIALGAGSSTSRWLYVNVDRTRSRDQDGPRNISLAFPLPLGFAAWFIRTFGGYIDGLKNTNVDDVVQVIAMAKDIKDPLIVHVDDGDDGERVQVFIG
ncbi:MAG: hypothetical protein IPG80_08345 [Anaerolineales bacterium]|uniref:SHOCT-like domain-containing protein n=1 Tax=Candidatus Villigracilis vicinus TaxID=3140679 RepID=UPI003137634F|nr:hypothetical protein [Anaerolineales bacterium]MBK9780568.1 hypothetical protein [Anaerolineales bacterium]